MSMSCCVMVNVLLRLTARPTYWRIAVILPGRILWRTYSRDEYPTPDDAVRRCLAGLAESSHQQHEPCPRAAGQNRELTPAEGHQSSPQSKTGQQHIENDHTERVQREDRKFLLCRALSSRNPSANLKSRTAQTEKHHGDDQGRSSVKLVTHPCPLNSASHYDPSNRDHHRHCGYPDDDYFHDLPLPSGIQPQTGQCPEEGRHGQAKPQRGFPAVDDNEATQHRCSLRFRAAWWGWL